MLRILTLGGLSVVHPERELSGAVLQPRRLALLAVLARAGERGVTRERLLSLFWPDDEDERARRALTQAVYALRRDLGNEHAIVGSQELRLDEEHITSDIGQFAMMLKRGRPAEAAALYAGPFLQGFHLVGAPGFERWADEERSAIAHEYAKTLERLAVSAERADQPQDAVTHWQALAAVDPLNASVAVRYMRALDRVGDRAGALRHARIYEALISQELELPPDRAVMELAAELRTAAPATAVEATATAVDAPATAVDVPASAVDVLATPVDVLATPVDVLATPAVRYRRIVALIAVVLVTVIISALALRDRSAGVSRLYAVDTKRVTFEEGLEVDPVISPDGKMIAYAAGSEGAMRIYVRQIDGGSPLLISGKLGGDHRRPKWSPDGATIVFQGARALWTVPSLGGSPRVVVEAPIDTTLQALYPSWSPDGRSLAYVVHWDIMVRDIESGSTRTLVTIPLAHSINWSPDAQLMAVASDNASFVYGAAGEMGFNGSNIGNIAPGLIYIANVSTGDTTRVTGLNHLSTSPDWLADGKSIVFVSNKDGARDLYALAINADGRPVGDAVRLTTGLDAHTVSVSRDGATLAYTTYRQSSNLWSVPVNGTALRVESATAVTTGDQTIEAMDVSPDGEWIAFDSDRGGQQDIFRVRTNGEGEPDRIVSSPTDDFHPAWSPDGRLLAFYRIRDGVRRGAVVSASGGPEKFIGPPTGALEEHSPVWTPDGRALVFHRYLDGHADLYRTTLENDSVWSTPQRVTERGGLWPTFASGSNEFAYLSRAGEVSVLSLGLPDLNRRVVIGPQNPYRLTVSYVRWIPGRRSLAVRARDAKGELGIWELPVDGGAPRQLLRFDDARRAPARPEFATDGRRLYFTLTERVADVWTATLGTR